MVDSRILQTQAALAEAVLDLAARTPVSKLGVAELTRRAGINRATFYDHYSSPGELLATVLNAEYDAMREQYLATRAEATTSPEAALRVGIDQTIDHVLERRDIYQRALVEAPDHELIAMMAGNFEDACFAILEATVRPQLPDAKARVVARFVASGLVGGIAGWLAEPDLTRHELAEVLVESFPRWWHQETAG